MPNSARVFLEGHLGGAPEFKAGQSGKPFARFSIAVNSGPKEKPVVSWYSCTASGYAHDQVAALNLDKGDAVFIKGRQEFCKTADQKGPFLTVWVDSVAKFPKLKKQDDQPAAQPVNSSGTPDDDLGF